MPVPQQRCLKLTLSYRSDICCHVFTVIALFFKNRRKLGCFENGVCFNKEKTVKMLCLLAKASTSTQTRSTMYVGCQTDPSQLRSVGTPLSFTKLQAKNRSKGLLMFLMLYVLNSSSNRFTVGTVYNDVP